MTTPSGRSFVNRILGLAVRDPRMVQSALKLEARRSLSMPLQRRLMPGKTGPPVNLSLNLTRRCNLRCHMCMQYRHDEGDSSGLDWYDSSQELDLSVWVKLLNQVRSFRPWISITGGEPTLYPGFGALIKALKERGLPGDVTTNGTTLADWADFLVEQGVAIVFVSLDGTEAIHDRVRGVKGAFQRTTHGIRRLVEARTRQGSPGPLIVTNFTINELNVDDVDRMVPLAMDLGVDIQQFIHPFFNSSANAEEQNRLFSREWTRSQGLTIHGIPLPPGEYYECDMDARAVSRIQEGLRTARRQASGRIRVKVLPSLGDDLLEPYYLDLQHPFPQVCNAMWQKARIMPDGTFSPCMHVVFGNIQDRPLMEMWNGTAMRRFREILSKRLFPACVRCCNRRFGP